jgi:hypothetical protein
MAKRRRAGKRLLTVRKAKRSDWTHALIALAVFIALVIFLAVLSALNIGATGGVTGIAPYGADSSGPLLALWAVVLLLLVPAEMRMRKG